jgi:hypothetical protein
LFDLFDQLRPSPSGPILRLCRLIGLSLNTHRRFAETVLPSSLHTVLKQHRRRVRPVRTDADVEHFTPAPAQVVAPTRDPHQRREIDRCDLNLTSMDRGIALRARGGPELVAVVKLDLHAKRAVPGALTAGKRPLAPNCPSVESCDGTATYVTGAANPAHPGIPSGLAVEKPGPRCANPGFSIN